jgi:hypothetical protein
MIKPKTKEETIAALDSLVKILEPIEFVMNSLLSKPSRDSIFEWGMSHSVQVYRGGEETDGLLCKYMLKHLMFLKKASRIESFELASKENGEWATINFIPKNYAANTPKRSLTLGELLESHF